MKNIVRSTLCVVLSFILVTLAISAQARPKSGFKYLYVFGDSLSDTGNDFIYTDEVLSAPIPVPPSVNYYDGRFSNGPVAFEYLWKGLTGNKAATVKPSLDDIDYSSDKAVSAAYGGAKTVISSVTPGGFEVPGVIGQIEQFINDVTNIETQLDQDKTLYAIWGGANDYLIPPNLEDVQNPDCPQGVNPIAPVVCNIVQAIVKLRTSLDAKHFVVVNLPDIGSAPMLNDPYFNFPPETSVQLTNLTIAHNTALKIALDQLKESDPEIQISYADAYSTINALINVFPYGNQMGPAGDCLFIDPALCSEPANGFNAFGYVFWDGQHPTTAVHGVLAVTIAKAILDMQ